MLSYRHALHAGNHGDVLKHVVLLSALRRAVERRAIDDDSDGESDLCVVDTHAGTGSYFIDDETTATAKKLRECEDGVLRLLRAQRGLLDDAEVRIDPPPAAVEAYTQVVHEFNEEGARAAAADGGVELALERYPGSPWIVARKSGRANNELYFFELHPDAHAQLRTFLARHSGEQTQMAVHNEDGFDGAVRVMSETKCRGSRCLVLIDPPFKEESEYERTADTVSSVLDIKPSSTILVWMPQLAGCSRSDELKEKLISGSERQGASWMVASLTVSTRGLLGSDVFVANPPPGLGEDLGDALPYLRDTLAKGTHACWELNQSSLRERNQTIICEAT